MTRTEALQAVLAGENAAIYAYGVVGARLRGTSDEKAARAALSTHVGRRNDVSEQLRAAGASPVGSAAAYDLGGPVTSASQARALAAKVELNLCGPYADLVAASETAERGSAASWCSVAAVTAVGWGGAPTAFPGLAERA